jgi:protocatechuate 3,4-dioxygenase beta subunit
MKRVGIVAGLGVVALVIVWWMRRDESSTKPTNGVKPATTNQVARTTAAQERPDPQKLKRASIEGVVTGDKAAPLAKARVCASGSSNDLDPELLRDLVCASTDDGGHYKLENLLPATYTIGASARLFRPEVHHPKGDPKRSDVRLAAGQQLTGIDIALRAGGVEITGVVSDLTGGPIEKARVSSQGSGFRSSAASVMTETAADGTFSLWVAPGGLTVSASAEGYADEQEWTYAPGKVELLLTPESAVSGTVVDAGSGEPIAGARVSVGNSEWGSDGGTFSDEKGAFRVARLTPGRYTATARTDHGYGRSDGSTLVGLGQSVDGVVVKLHAAVRVEGKVMVSSTKQPCEKPSISLSDSAKGRWTETRSERDGRVWAEGVLPGKYTVDVSCSGFRSKEKYEPVVVADKDVTGLEWEVDAGATVTGKVLAKSGQPVDGASVSARTVGGEARKKGGWGYDRALPDGTYTLEGMRAGTYKLEVSTEKGAPPKEGYKVDVADTGVVQKDLVLEDTGTIRGTIVDGQGKPQPGIQANARSLAGSMTWRDNDHKSDETGAFTIEGLRPGEYKVTAGRTWMTTLRKPGTTDDAEQGERATVRANQTATVKIVVESQTGAIKGTVTDAAGFPVADAFLSAARESDAAGAQKTAQNQTRWSWDEKPVLTATDGTFTLTKLSPGNYTVRAYRKGGGEAVAEHVAIGGTAVLQIKPTGSVSGTVKGAPEEMAVTARDLATGFSRRESYFRTDGRFAIHDLPKGKFKLSVTSAVGSAEIDLELGEGEQKTGVAIELAQLLTLTGRVVVHGTTTPVPALRMMAVPANGGSFSFSSDDERGYITDEQGRFTLKNIASGKLTIRAMPRDFRDSEYSMMMTVREVSGTGTVELGDLPIFKKRVKDGDPVGKLGIRFAEQPPETPPDKREFVISWLDPTGPAAKSELKVGDTITSIDGIDVTGGNSSAYSAMTRAAPGTKLSFGTKRGATVIVVLAAP